MFPIKNSCASPINLIILLRGNFICILPLRGNDVAYCVPYSQSSCWKLTFYILVKSLNLFSVLITCFNIRFLPQFSMPSTILSALPLPDTLGFTDFSLMLKSNGRSSLNRECQKGMPCAQESVQGAWKRTGRVGGSLQFGDEAAQG